MDKIPIEFEYENKTYKGNLSQVNGAGVFHLSIDNFHYGQLFYTIQGWQFASNNDHFKGMGEFFGNYIIAWYDGL